MRAVDDVSIQWTCSPPGRRYDLSPDCGRYVFRGSLPSSTLCVEGVLSAHNRHCPGVRVYEGERRRRSVGWECASNPWSIGRRMLGSDKVNTLWQSV